MPTYNKFQDFVEQLVEGVHDFDAHTFRLFLSSTAPTAGMAALSEVTGQIAYTNISGGVAPQVTMQTSEASGTMTVAADAVVVTATGTVPTFRYYGIYNDSATTPVVDALVCWWDHGSDVNLATSETFTVNFNNDPTAGTIFTLT